MRNLRQSLLTTTALAALSVFALGSFAQGADMVISAPGAGQTVVPSTNLSVDLLTVGNAAGQTGELDVGTGVTVTIANGAIIGDDAGSTGRVVVSGAGAVFNDAAYLKVGNYGTGTFVAQDGASVTIGDTAYIGTVDNAENPTISGAGAMTVTGTGTRVTLNGLYLQNYGANSSSLVVSDGAVLSNNLGLYAMGHSSIVVTGSDTVLKIGARDDDQVTWDNTDGWLYMSQGSLVLSDGALLDTDGSYIGGEGTGLVTATITGAGTRWINGLPIYIGGDGHDPNGQLGNATVTVSDGAYVRASTSAVGVDQDSIGKLTITGKDTLYEVVPNASANAAGNFRVGFSGNGTVTVSDGATLRVSGRLDIATSGGAVGVLNIGAAEGDAAAAAGIIETSAWSGDPDELSGLYFGEGDATLVFNHTSDDYTFDAMMRGTGATIKQIAGTTRLTGDSSSLAGTIYVTGGKLFANGFLNAADAEVSDGGFLGGSGVLNNVLVGDGGVFSAGDPAGTIGVNGNLRVANGGTLQVDLGPNGQDLVHLQGGFKTATIDDGAALDVRLSAGLDLTQNYTIIQVESGTVVKSAGFTVTDHAPLLDTLVTYNASSVVLHIAAADVDWDDTVATDNQKAAAAAVQALGSGNDTYDQALFLTDETIGQGFDLLSGEIHATTKSVLASDTRLLRELSMDHSQAAEASGGAMGYTSTESTAWVSPDSGLGAPSRMWLEGYGSLFSSDGNGNAGAVEAKSGGLIAGVDNDLGALQVGALAGYSHSAIDQADRDSTANVDTGHIGVYGGTELDGFKVRGGGALSWNVISTSRTTIIPDEVLSADYSALTSQAFAELGYALDLDGVTIEPFGQLAVVGISTEAYSETGGPSALSADASFDAIGFATIGLRSTSVVVSADGQLKLSGQLAWQHAFGDTDPTSVQNFAGGNSFSVSGTPLATDTLLAQVGVTRTISDNASLGLSYDGEFAENASRHQVSGRFEVKF